MFVIGRSILSDNGSSAARFFKNESADGNRDHAEGKVVSLRLKPNFYGNSEKCDILLCVGWASCLD